MCHSASVHLDSHCPEKNKRLLYIRHEKGRTLCPVSAQTCVYKCLQECVTIFIFQAAETTISTSYEKKRKEKKKVSVEPLSCTRHLFHDNPRVMHTRRSPCHLALLNSASWITQDATCALFFSLFSRSFFEHNPRLLLLVTR